MVLSVGGDGHRYSALAARNDWVPPVAAHFFVSNAEHSVQLIPAVDALTIDWCDEVDMLRMMER